MYLNYGRTNDFGATIETMGVIMGYVVSWVSSIYNQYFFNKLCKGRTQLNSEMNNQVYIYLMQWNIICLTTSTVYYYRFTVVSEVIWTRVTQCQRQFPNTSKIYTIVYYEILFFLYTKENYLSQWENSWVGCARWLAGAWPTPNSTEIMLHILINTFIFSSLL